MEGFLQVITEGIGRVATGEPQGDGFAIACGFGRIGGRRALPVVGSAASPPFEHAERASSEAVARAAAIRILFICFPFVAAQHRASVVWLCDTEPSRQYESGGAFERTVASDCGKANSEIGVSAR